MMEDTIPKNQVYHSNNDRGSVTEGGIMAMYSPEVLEN